MATVKLKFRLLSASSQEGMLVYQVIHRREVRRIKSKYRIFSNEWDDENGNIRVPFFSVSRYRVLRQIVFDVKWEMNRLNEIIHRFEQQGVAYSVCDIVRIFRDCILPESVFDYIHRQAIHLKQSGRFRSGEMVQSTLNSLMRFRNGMDFSFDMMDTDLIEEYEAYLKRTGLVRNTTSFYMRILRTIYHSAVEQRLTEDRYPFRHIYLGVDRTIKRALSFEDIKKIKRLDLSGHPALDFARDMFIFSFCARGMSFVDMAYLRKKDLENNMISYRRRKTGRVLTIEWIEQMQEVLDKYPENPTSYLLPIITHADGEERHCYQNQQVKINRRLKYVARLAGLAVPLSMYYARHSWASIARGKNIPLAVISEGLGHDSEVTTRIYLDSIKSSVVDKANKRILKGL